MIEFSVGNGEKHNIRFTFNSFTGSTKILVDDKVHTATRIMLMGFTPFAFQVGENEKHAVRIELNNPAFFAFIGSSVKVYVDEKMVRQDHIGSKAGLAILLLIIIFLLIVGFSFFYSMDALFMVFSIL